MILAAAVRLWPWPIGWRHRAGRVVLFPLRGAAEGTAVERHPHHWLYIGQIGKFLEAPRAEGCRDGMVFIGALVRPSIWHVHPDRDGLSFLPRVLKALRGGDNHPFCPGMSTLLEGEGLRLRGAERGGPGSRCRKACSTVSSRRGGTAPILSLAWIICAHPAHSMSAVVVAGLRYNRR